MSKKVALPQEIVIALDRVKDELDWSNDVILSKVYTNGWDAVWSQPLNLGGIENWESAYRVAQGLVNGYEFEKTPEAAVRDFFDYLKESHEYAKRSGYAEQIDRYYSNMHAVKFVLSALGITIEGINAKEDA